MASQISNQLILLQRLRKYNNRSIVATVNRCFRLLSNPQREPTVHSSGQSTHERVENRNERSAPIYHYSSVKPHEQGGDSFGRNSLDPPSNSGGRLRQYEPFDSRSSEQVTLESFNFDELKRKTTYTKYIDLQYEAVSREVRPYTGDEEVSRMVLLHSLIEPFTASRFRPVSRPHFLFDWCVIIYQDGSILWQVRNSR